MGMTAPYQITNEKNVMKACMEVFATNGYYTLGISSIRRQDLHEDNPDVAAINKLLSINRNDMV